MTKIKLTGTEERPLNIVYYFLKEYFQEGKRIVDVGCGYGRHLKIMPRGSCGIDIVRPPKDLVRRYNIILHELNTGNLPFRNDSIDVLFCSHVIEHLRSPFDALREFHRVLKEGGVLLLGIPNPDCIYFDFYGLSKKQDWNEHLYAWDVKQAKRFITNCGFSVENIYCNFPFSQLIGQIWNSLPWLKRHSSDLWFVCIKQGGRVYLKSSKRYLLGKLLVKLGLSGAMSQEPFNKKEGV